MINDPQVYLPLNEPVFYILLSLAPGIRHGYAILKDVEDFSRGEQILSTSTLYDALGRLLQQGLVERVDGVETGTTARPRKSYILTSLGRRVLAAEAQRMEQLLKFARLRLEKETP